MLSKSKYTTFCLCEKALWLKQNKPELAKENLSKLARFKEGN